MNKFLIFALFLALTNCVSKISECDSGINGDIYLDTTKKYEYKVEFDWTDKDELDIKVPIFTDATAFDSNKIIPFFINTSTIEEYKAREYKSDEIDDMTAVKIYDKYPVFYPFKATITESLISGKDKSTAVKANENDVTQKFMKYFGIAYCTGEKEVTTKIFREILVIINNGNYFSTSKILLACLALLFL